MLGKNTKCWHEDVRLLIVTFFGSENWIFPSHLLYKYLNQSAAAPWPEFLLFFYNANGGSYHEDVKFEQWNFDLAHLSITLNPFFLGQQMVKVIITLVGKLGMEIAPIEDLFEMISVMNDGQLRNVYQNNNLKFTQFKAVRNKIMKLSS